MWLLDFRLAKGSLPRRRSYRFVTRSFLTHEGLLQPVSTSVQANWPITGRLPFFVKWDFDLKFISRVHENIRSSILCPRNFVFGS